jgi:hypothetical protein
LSIEAGRQDDRLVRETERVVAGGFVIIAMVLSCTACAPVKLLTPEERATLHVGQTVALDMPATYGGLVAGAGDALLLLEKKVRGDEILYRYRAVQPGNQVFLAVSEKRDCVSCVAVHWFVTVIQ